MDPICDFNVLVYYYFNNCWLWWSPSCEYKGDDLWHLLYALLTLDWQHIWLEIWPIWLFMGPVELEDLWVILIHWNGNHALQFMNSLFIDSPVFSKFPARCHTSSFEFCSEEPTASAPARSDACTSMFEVQDWFRRTSAARNSWFPSKSNSF